ncbi:MAG TPA: cytochrome b/b6 domain-containing protein [Allosphingosinicella sp.]|nr:cytochrome b/b6 domain-containing protein [Allosphingosinicella sp.]
MNEATRVAATATRTRYDSTSIALHWITVALVLLNFASAELWGLFARPTRHAMVVSHMSLGIILSLVVVLRIVWRLMPGHQVEPASQGWDEKLAKAVQFLLYLLLLLQSVLGYIVRWSEGEDMSFFGLLIPPPFAPMSRATHHTLMQRHDQIGWAIIIIAAGHAAAALYHHFVLRDRVLVRMLPRGSIDPA